jgi:hypothetical protein
MIWTLLISVVFFMPVIAVLDSTKRVGVDSGGYVLPILVGAVVGACCAGGMWKLGETVGTRASKLQSESRRKWYFRLLYFSAIFWIFLAAILGKYAAAAVLRFAA